MSKYGITEEQRIFSGPASRDIWKAINRAKTRRDLREALWLVCCRIQELEEKVQCEQVVSPAYGRGRSWRCPFRAAMEVDGRFYCKRHGEPRRPDE